MPFGGLGLLFKGGVNFIAMGGGLHSNAIRGAACVDIYMCGGELHCQRRAGERVWRG